MKIFYVHHALRALGNPPSQNDDITPIGEEDAKIVAEILQKISEKRKIKAIYTSPYLRCAKTAKIINEKINVPIFEEPRFNEFNKVFEAVEGNKTIIKTESWKDCQKRIRAAIKDIVFSYNEEDTVVCVTSGVNISAFIGLAFKLPPSENMPFPWVPSCSPIGFDIDRSSFNCEEI